MALLRFGLGIGTIASAGQSEQQTNLSKRILTPLLNLMQLQKNIKRLFSFFMIKAAQFAAHSESKGIYPQTAAQLHDIIFAQAEKVTGSQLHSKFQVKRYPTFVFFKDGKQLHNVPSFKDPKVKTDRYEGYKDNPMFTQLVSNVFSGSGPQEAAQ